MLAPPERYRCIECGKAMGRPDFTYHQGRMENGPAYWCDRGILCSLECSLTHHKKRVSEGTLPDRPAADPFSDI